jgi:hypothetical protein
VSGAFLRASMAPGLRGDLADSEDWARAKARKGADAMNNIFYIIGVVVVVIFLLGYFGLR